MSADFFLVVKIPSNAGAVPTPRDPAREGRPRTRDELEGSLGLKLQPGGIHDTLFFNETDADRKATELASQKPGLEVLVLHGIKVMTAETPKVKTKKWNSNGELTPE